MHKSFCEHMSSITLGMYLVVELLGQMYGNSVFNIMETDELFPKWLCHFTPVCKGFNFPTSSPDTWYCPSFFKHSYPSGYEGVSHCGFDLRFRD